ncbi:MAG TPA: molybdenum cofactor biosynthesis protein MoaE [Verrucomicrobiae bacterium]|nr:molybdenum cofactor biosynthesis protein MoaE [Verrucomicrobiae bacterium]
MEIDFQLTSEPIAENISPPPSSGASGAWLEFRGVVRGDENGQTISALEYEAYPEMAVREIRRILEMLAIKHPCLAAKVIHRVGVIPVGEVAIYVGISSPHRGEAIALLAEFMNQLKRDVPIWKRRGIVAAVCDRRARHELSKPGARRAPLQLDDTISEIQSHCQPLPPVRVPLTRAFGCVLRETVCAPEDMPAFDRSTRDGYAILSDDSSESFRVVDTLHAADWKSRQLKPGETVRVATGSALPCENLRVVMQENVECLGDQIRIVRRETARNVSARGEDLRAGEALLEAGVKVNAGALALLATAGVTNPLVGPRLHVVHFTTGDEIIPPGQKPKPGQIRDSNSFLIRGLLQQFPCDLHQAHLPEDFEKAKIQIGNRQSAIGNSDLLLVSGGASVGEKDFTRPLLEWLGFEIVFSQVNVRPGRPLIFGLTGNRIAFGLPGNPLSHFVCFHLFVATALAKLIGEAPKTFQRGRLAAKLDDAPNPRETFWPARLNVGPASCLSPIQSPAQAEQKNRDRRDAGPTLTPLKWSSSGDVTCLAEANALIRVPANQGPIQAGVEMEFLPTEMGAG